MPSIIKFAFAVALATVTACGFSPGGGAPGGGDDDQPPVKPPHLAGFPGSGEIGPPLVANIMGCWLEGEGTPEDDGRIVGRPERILCGVTARGCVGFLTDADANVEIFPLLPTGQEDHEWGASFLPNLGQNDLQVICSGDGGTNPAAEMIPEFWVMDFTLEGVEVLAPDRYRLLNRAALVTWRWNLPGAEPGTCAGSAPVGFGFTGQLPSCPVGSLGPTQAVSGGGSAATVPYTITAPGYRGTVTLEIPASL